MGILMDMYDALPGTSLSPGVFTISRSESERLEDVLGRQVPDGDEAHPLYAFIAAQRGIGVTVAELCALAEFRIEDGPLLGTLDFEFHQPLQLDVEYAVEGEILDVVRKRGRALGDFDVLTFRERLHGADGEAVAAVTSSFILPRKSRTSG